MCLNVKLLEMVFITEGSRLRLLAKKTEGNSCKTKRF